MSQDNLSQVGLCYEQQKRGPLDPPDFCFWLCSFPQFVIPLPQLRIERGMLKVACPKGDTGWYLPIHLLVTRLLRAWAGEGRCLPPVHSSEVYRLNVFDSSDLHPFTRDHDTNDKGKSVSAHLAQQVATSPPLQTFVGIPRSKHLGSPNLWGVQTSFPHISPL